MERIISAAAPPRPRRAPLDPVARRLLQARVLRSLGQGALIANFVLYLQALGWSATAIGVLVGAGSFSSAALSLLAGVLSDRFGRRRLLLAFQVAIVVLTAALLLHPVAWVVVAMALVLGLGSGGANATAGPFGSAEQAWLAQHIPTESRGRIFSLNNAAWFIGMGAGSLLGAAVPWLAHRLPGPAAYEPCFALAAVVAAVYYLQVAPLRETRQPRTPPQAPHARTTRGRENRTLGQMVAVNAIGALGTGLFSPLLPYWFSVRYGAGPAAIGPVFALGFLLAAAASLLNGGMTERMGLVQSVVWLRLSAVAMLVAMPLMPTFGWAAALYTVRSALNRGTSGARQAFAVNIVRDERRGFATSLSNLSVRVPSSVGPAIGGWLFALGDLDLPFFMGAALQLGYVALFGTLFRKTAFEA